MKHIKCLLLFSFMGCAVFAQRMVRGVVRSGGQHLEGVSVRTGTQGPAVKTDSLGRFFLQAPASSPGFLHFSAVGYRRLRLPITPATADTLSLDVQMEPEAGNLNDVVVSGTLKAVRREDSPVNVEVYNALFFAKNPTPTIFDALQHVNGIRPQLNCNVCNTGDIHMNGLEGPYTMVLIDGMPIVSGLSTVYGLSGIPASLIERVEVVKGPASSLYGSEAVGGLINVITKNAANTPSFTADAFATGWGEYNTDLGLKFNAGRSASVLTGLNHFNFNNRIDHNHDGFTDMTLQQRLSLFQKWDFNRPDGRKFSLAGRYLYEDRWGGQTNWTRADRGSGSVYAESIYTKRWEVFGTYQLPLPEKVFLAFSYNNHDQNSVYGTDLFAARQQIAFGQLTWDKKAGMNDLLFGAALRYTYYNDNTPATPAADHVLLPGLFLQNEISLSEVHKLLLGVRYDHHSVHGNIFTPRLAYKWNLSANDILRMNAGSGFRVVNLFTEDHAALSGAREVVILEALKPERSYNVNLNYLKKLDLGRQNTLNLDFSGWYTYFNNRITADYDTAPTQIRYANLDGYGITKGLSLNLDLTLGPFNAIAGASLLDVRNVERDAAGNRNAVRPVKSESWMGTWAISYRFESLNMHLDYTGSVIGPMRLALLGPLDQRPAYSPAWSIQNIQLTKRFRGNLEIYGGVKNLLNWTISRKQPGGSPIARAFDPFDRYVQFDGSGQVVPVNNVSPADPAYNPQALKFDPDGYSYGPNQGIRGFLGLRLFVR
ncbi:TonB-dependent receptor [Pedobacter yulinensis]|uniref:TonB-dependent receptor n=1 Tax=Pedobacter yulinensis TaxID=2126353 RepID=A0A2T3HI86_9SPHI|nr:TonB-dependent receptor [Pedobacter yulinensis]PST82149.1 TonB-dependent receptor [Pedobacter yulinensis]